MTHTTLDDNELKRLLNNPAKNANEGEFMAPSSTSIWRPSTSENVNPQLMMNSITPTNNTKEIFGTMFTVKFSSFKIQNIVATYDLKFPIKLENLNSKHRQFSTYEPELYPGLTYRMIQSKVVLLIFVNGKIVLTGAKERIELQDALNNIYPILKSFRKQ